MFLLVIFVVFVSTLNKSDGFTQSRVPSLRYHQKSYYLNAESPCPNAAKCSGEYRSKGCDGTGKIQGGIATIGFMSWWPIKVFRPCPSYLAAGYQYRREGQTMDQVLFSEPSTKMQEKMISIRKEEEERKARESSETDIEKSNQEESEAELTPEEKFLQDRFGG
mmetsp:Transcript_26417/g.26667  ORF Transcript_26417/g.26667 Transcript_26417/m.26667 type:complete len:164 (+) Transcript_26417:100-591(+)